MSNASKSIPQPASERNEADAATEALKSFAQSAKDFLRYQQIYAEGAQVKRKLLQNQIEAKEKDDKIKELESVIAVWTRSGNEQVIRVESEKSSLRSQLQCALKEKEKAEAQARETGRQLDEQRDGLGRLKKDMYDLKAKQDFLEDTLRKETATKNDTAASLNNARTELQKYAGYTTELIDLDMKQFYKGAQRIRERTTTLVEKYFSVDIPTDVLKEHEKWTQQACSFIKPPSGTILIPPTNTTAAKFARNAVMMNVFAIVLSQYICTAISTPFTQVGLDAILCDLSDQDSQKELLCRAILTSALNGTQIEPDDFSKVVKGIVDGFAFLQDSTSRSSMKSEIKQLLTEASDWWAPSRRSRQKVIATLDHGSYPDMWKSYPARCNQYRKDSRDTEASDPEDEDEVAFVSFPAIIAMVNGEWRPVHYGFLTRYSDIWEAEREWREERSKRRFSRSGVPGNTVGLPSGPARGLLFDPTS